MKVLFCGFLISMSFSIAKGQCLGDTAFRTIRSCDGSVRSGSFVSVDMNKIGRPCTCTVKSLFIGDLLVTSFKVTTSLCNTRVIVNNKVVFNCNEYVSLAFEVGVNDILFVKAEHTSGNITDSLHQCVGFSENRGLGGNLSVTCGTPPDSSTTQAIFTTTTSSTLESKSALHSNIHVIALSAAGSIVLFVFLVVCSFIMRRRKNRKNKANSPEMHFTLSYKVFDSSNELPDNPLYTTCQTEEKVNLHVTSKQNQQIALPQQTALNNMHRIDPDYDVPLNNKPTDQDASSVSLFEVPNSKSINSDLLPMPLYAVPNNRFIKRGPTPTPMYAVPQQSHEHLPEVKDGDVNNQYYSTAKNPV